MAEDLTPRPSEAAAAEESPVVGEQGIVARPAAPRSARSRPYRYRFGVAYLVLAVIAGVGVGSAILLFEREPAAEEARWSAWQPVGRENSFAAQIAERIGQRYRNPEGGQLVGVIASAPQVQIREGAVPLQWVALQGETATSTANNGDDFDIVPLGDQSLMYTLCGLGDGCSLAEGLAGETSARMLRREALELALYSFKYVEGVRSVIALLPPNLGDPTDPQDDRQTALFFQRSDFKLELGRPVQETLAGRPPAGVPVNRLERLTVDRLTEPRLFIYDFQPTQAGGWVIVLAPFNLP